MLGKTSKYVGFTTLGLLIILSVAFYGLAYDYEPYPLKVDRL